MKKMRVTLILIVLLTAMMHGVAQSFNIGIRAGQNYSKVLAPKEAGESINFAGGFHFGLSFQYNIAENLGIKTEFLYNQNGYSQEIHGEGYYMIRKNSGGLAFERGTIDQNLTVSNAYLVFPITAQYQLNKKWEVFGGAYAGILIGPTGRGTIDFVSTLHPDEVLFRQSLDYKYGSDEAGGVALRSQREPLIRVDGELVTLPKGAGAYYQYLEKNGNLFKKLDFGLIGGVSYYLNRGFFVSARVDFGLRDITNTNMDRSFIELEEDNSIVTRDDRDINLNFGFSFGFKF